MLNLVTEFLVDRRGVLWPMPQGLEVGRWPGFSSCCDGLSPVSPTSESLAEILRGPLPSNHLPLGH